MLAKLTDLPTEIILQILQDDQIQPTDIYAVGIVSRRLNSIAIPLLLEAKGVSNPAHSISLSFHNNSFPPSQLYRGTLGMYVSNSWPPEKNVALEAAIMVAFYVPSIRKVKCTFPQPFTDLRVLLHHLDRLSGLISRLKFVKSITFHFAGDQRYRHLSLNPLSANPILFAYVFSGIIQSLASKGCETLFLYNQSYHIQAQRASGVGPDEPPSIFYPSTRLPNVSPPETKSIPGISRGKIVSIPSVGTSNDTASTRKLKGGKGVLGRAKAKIGSTLSYFRTSTLAPPSVPPKDTHLLYPPFDPSLSGHRGTLRAIHIQTPFALLPRCLPAIRNLIHSSINTLTSLTLSYIVFNEGLFESCLLSLCLNRTNAITHLSILHCRHIAPKSLLEFISCFQGRLEYLELDRGISFVTGTENLPPRLHFHELHTLKAPLDLVTYLLTEKPQRSGNDSDFTVTPPLPNLSSMTIQCRSTTAVNFTYSTFRPLLDTVLQPLYLRWEAASRYSQVPKIDITLDIKLDRTHPWQMDLDREALNIVTPYLDSSQRSRSITSPGKLLPSIQILSTTPRVALHWDLVSKLELSPTYPPVNTIQADSLAQWVTTIFPAVEQVNLPLPRVPSSTPVAQYKNHQKEIAHDAVGFLRKALWDGRIHEDSPPLVWKTLVIGQWTFPFNLDLDGEESTQAC